jgi:hypothetical protein
VEQAYRQKCHSANPMLRPAANLPEHFIDARSVRDDPIAKGRVDP